MFCVRRRALAPHVHTGDGPTVVDARSGIQYKPTRRRLCIQPPDLTPSPPPQPRRALGPAVGSIHPARTLHSAVSLQLLPRFGLDEERWTTVEESFEEVSRQKSTVKCKATRFLRGLLLRVYCVHREYGGRHPEVGQRPPPPLPPVHTNNSEGK